MKKIDRSLINGLLLNGNRYSRFIEYLRSGNKTKTTLYRLPPDLRIYVSSVTVYELYIGATDLTKYGHINTLLGDIPILNFDMSVAEKAAEIYHALRKTNQMIEFRDIFIGATAVVHDLPLKTLNKKHFKRISSLRLD